jgi:hypothetical protein
MPIASTPREQLNSYFEITILHGEICLGYYREANPAKKAPEMSREVYAYAGDGAFSQAHNRTLGPGDFFATVMWLGAGPVRG